MELIYVVDIPIHIILSIESSLEFTDSGPGLDVNSGSGFDVNSGEGSGIQISRKEPTIGKPIINTKTCAFLCYGFDI